MRRLFLLVLLCVAAFAAPASAAQKGVVVDLTWGVSEETQQRTGVAMKDAGAQWVRMNVGWKWMEPERGSYDPGMLAKVDRAVSISRAAGARIIMLVDQAPEWASGSADARYPAKDPADAAAFYAFLLKRYGTDVDAWEVWNEPNHPHYWQPDPTKDPNACAGYLALLRAVFPVVRAHDPGAVVLFGGLAFNDYPYLERCYAIDPDMGDFFDAMNTHPYAMGGAAPETLKDESPKDGRLDYQTFLAYREVRKTMAARGDVKPVWLTEFGWSTATDGHPLGNVSPEVQADYLTRAFKVLEQDAYVPVATWYSLRNAYTGADGPGWLDQLGLMKTDFTPKPAYFAFQGYTPPAPPPATTGQDQPPGDPATPNTTETKPGQTVAPLPGQVATSVGLRVRRRATRRGRRQIVRLSGIVRGASSGAVWLTVERARARGKWRRVRRAAAPVRSSGRFSRRVRLRRGARWRAYAAFTGWSASAPSASRYRVFRTPAARR